MVQLYNTIHYHLNSTMQMWSTVNCLGVQQHIPVVAIHIYSVTERIVDSFKCMQCTLSQECIAMGVWQPISAVIDRAQVHKYLCTVHCIGEGGLAGYLCRHVSLYGANLHAGDGVGQTARSVDDYDQNFDQDFDDNMQCASGYLITMMY